MARTLDAIIAELGGVYDPLVANVRKKQDMLPEQVRTEESALEGKQSQAFDSILAGARRRGLGFAGIPLGEQAQYTSTEFLPAVARLKQSAREQAMSLEDAILQIGERRRQAAQGIYDNELARELEQQRLAEQQRQFNEDLAFRRAEAARAARAGAGGGGFALGGGGGGGGAAKAAPVWSFKNGKNGAGGFAFKDPSGRPISAAKFAQLTGKNIGDVLYWMGQSGDRYAMQTYNAIKAAPGVAKRPQALFWGL